MLGSKYVKQHYTSLTKLTYSPELALYKLSMPLTSQLAKYSPLLWKSIESIDGTCNNHAYAFIHPSPFEKKSRHLLTESRFSGSDDENNFTIPYLESTSGFRFSESMSL
jgi:hypothetical protein